MTTADTFGLTASDWDRFHAVQRFAELVPGGRPPVLAEPSPGSAKPVAAFSTPHKLRDTLLAPRQPVYECLSPDGDRLLTESHNNLALRSALDDRIDLMTDDGCADVTWSVEGALWSPDGRYVTAIRTDTTGLDRLPIVDWLTPQQ